MIKIDLIILSYAKNDEFRNMTEDCIKSIINSEEEGLFLFNIIVLETNTNTSSYNYINTKTIYPDEKFGFNRYFNIGYKESVNEYICFCNNDLIFHKNWATELFKIEKKHKEIGSFCSKDPWLHKQYNDLNLNQNFIIGYDKMKHFTGWFFMTKRSVIQRVGAFDEKLDFWYCDDDFINVLKKYNIPNVLVTNSVITHLGSKTLSSIEQKKRNFMTNKQWVYYDYKWHHKSKLIYFLKYLKYLFISVIK
jgi:GT2 family glycosyltransferase